MFRLIISSPMGSESGRFVSASVYWRRSSSAMFEEFGDGCLLSLSVPLHEEEI
jgi:hypothetical protein